MPASRVNNGGGSNSQLLLRCVTLYSGTMRAVKSQLARQLSDRDVSLTTGRLTFSQLAAAELPNSRTVSYHRSYSGFTSANTGSLCVVESSSQIAAAADTMCTLSIAADQQRGNDDDASKRTDSKAAAAVVVKATKQNYLAASWQVQSGKRSRSKLSSGSASENLVIIATAAATRSNRAELCSGAIDTN